MRQRLHLHSSSVFCGAKYRGGVRRAEGFKSSHIQVFNLFFFNPSPRDWRPSVSPLYCWRHTGEKCEFLFVHSSQQREERTKKRRRCYRACSLGRCCRCRGLWNSLRSDSPRPGSSVGRRPPGPIKAVFPAGYACLISLTPLLGTTVPRFLPYMAGATQRRSVNTSTFPPACQQQGIVLAFPFFVPSLLVVGVHLNSTSVRR